MEKANYIKGAIISIVSFFTALLGTLGIPVIILVLSNVTDYTTGLIAAGHREESINSYKSFKGIAKKICMWLLVFVGGLLDWLILHVTKTIGIDIRLPFLISIVVAVWLICNEIISILENVKDIGVELPPILEKVTRNIKSQVEKKGDIQDDDQ